MIEEQHEKTEETKEETKEEETKSEETKEEETKTEETKEEETKTEWSALETIELGDDYKPPEGVDGDVLKNLLATWKDNPYNKMANEWAKKHGVSADALKEIVVGMHENDLKADKADAVAQKAALGADADKIIGRVAQWAKQNLSANEFETFKSVATDAETMKMFDTLRSRVTKSNQPTAPGQNINAQSAQAEYAKLIKSDAYHDERHEKHSEVNKRAEKLLQEIHGSKSSQSVTVTGALE